MRSRDTLLYLESGDTSLQKKVIPVAKTNDTVPEHTINDKNQPLTIIGADYNPFYHGTSCTAFDGPGLIDVDLSGTSVVSIISSAIVIVSISREL